MTNLLYSSCSVRVSGKTKRNCSSCADPGTRGRNGERGKMHGADFVTRSNYLVTDARQDRRIGRPSSSPIIIEMLLAAAAAVSIRSSDSIDYTNTAFQPRGGRKVSDRDVCRHFDRVVSSRPRRPSYIPSAN